MSTRTIRLENGLYQYLQDVSLREPSIMARCRQETEMLPLAELSISPEQGQLLAFLVEISEARRALEIGTFTGYAALWIASALADDGTLVTLGDHEEWARMARRFWQDARLMHKIDLRLGSPLETLEELIDTETLEPFDFAFIDGDKHAYDRYYEMVLELVRPGGLIAIDNVLWAGKVARAECDDPDTRAIRALNEKIHEDPRVSMSLVPIGDGMTVIRKRAPNS
jgi:predicted O-methyltransferase YrrM